MEWMDQDGKIKTTRVYQNLASEWKEVADFLGLTSQKKKIIEKDCCNSMDCIVKVFETWMDNEEELKPYSCTWNGLCGLLNDMERSTLSQEVRSVFGSLESKIHGSLLLSFPSSYFPPISHPPQ